MYANYLSSRTLAWTPPSTSSRPSPFSILLLVDKDARTVVSALLFGLRLFPVGSTMVPGPDQGSRPPSIGPVPAWASWWSDGRRGRVDG